MSKPSILIIEDERALVEVLTYNLQREGYEATVAHDGQEGLRKAQTLLPDLILLDLMLPDMDGLTICRRVRADPKTAGIVIAILSARGNESDVVAGLNAGANDYITKPFSPAVLAARVKAALRNSASAGGTAAQSAGSEGEIKIRNLVVHFGRHLVLVDGEPVELSATEFRVLQFLVQRPGWVFTREQILDAVHGDNYAITERAVDVQIVGLRRKLRTAGKYIETLRGVGYRFKD